MTRETKAKLEQGRRKEVLQDELNALLDIPVSEWTNNQCDRVEALASILGYTEDDKFWHA